MNRKKEIPQETELEQSIPQDDTLDTSEKALDDILENWTELQRVLGGASIDELFEKGWRPLLKSKPNGKQYITLRLHGKDPADGHQIDTERGLGLLNPDSPERWETLTALYEASKPTLPSVVPRTNLTSSTTATNRSSVLTTKVGRVAPIGPSVQIKLGTLQWFNWVQQVCGYPGTLDDFINDTVDSYFRAHHHLELAVVVQGGQNQ